MIQNVAPMMGFEVERAEILSNNMPEEPQLDTQRSNISTDMRDEIKNMIDARVKEQLNESLSNLNLSTQEEETKPKNQAVHHGIICDVCRVSPIKGIRFKSLIKEDYDLCEKCEKTNNVDHPMIRFRKPVAKRAFCLNRHWKKYSQPFRNLYQRQEEGGNQSRQTNPFEAMFGGARRCPRQQGPNVMNANMNFEAGLEGLNNFLGSIFDMQKMHCNTKDAQPKTEEKPKAEEKKQEEAPKPKKAHKLAHIRTPQQTNNLPKEDPRLEGVVDKVLAILPHLPRDVVKEFVAEKDLIETDENSRLEAVIKQFM